MSAFYLCLALSLSCYLSEAPFLQDFVVVTTLLLLWKNLTCLNLHTGP